jgi:hypothetical protein
VEGLRRRHRSGSIAPMMVPPGPGALVVQEQTPSAPLGVPARLRQKIKLEAEPEVRKCKATFIGQARLWA